MTMSLEQNYSIYLKIDSLNSVTFVFSLSNTPQTENQYNIYSLYPSIKHCIKNSLCYNLRNILTILIYKNQQ